MSFLSHPSGVDAWVAWLYARAPALGAHLAPAAEAAALSDAARRFGRPLDPELVAFYARHDGQRYARADGDDDALAPVIAGLELLPVSLARLEHLGLVMGFDAEGGSARAAMFDPAWWPFARVSRDDGYLCVDHRAATRAGRHPVVYVTRASPGCVRVSASLDAWFQSVTLSLAARHHPLTARGLLVDEASWMRLLGLELAPLDGDADEALALDEARDTLRFAREALPARCERV
ncbi:MAG: SMI1/KNR4 family protein [Myxococcales bacterium]|nr:SMI1/KNR4 family protein [Myxococcales bacterium]